MLHGSVDHLDAALSNPSIS